MKQVFLAGCVFIKDSKILLLKRIKRGWYELPGGKIESFESAQDAAVREIKEELGVHIEIIQKLGTKDFIDDDYKMSYTWFEARFCEAEEPEIKELQTFEELRYILLDDLKKYHLSPNMLNFVKALEEQQIFLSTK